MARWLPFVTASAITAVALLTAAVIWRNVAGHVHPGLDVVEVGRAGVVGRTDADDIPPAVVAGAVPQPAVGVSSDVQ